LNSNLFVVPQRGQFEFHHLSAFFTIADDRNKRNMDLSTFWKYIQMIKIFVVRGSSSDVQRGLSVGVIFSKDFLLVNTQKRKAFMHRSKSCLNGCFSNEARVRKSMKDFSVCERKNLRKDDF
jgi:hypothetical protein